MIIEPRGLDLGLDLFVGRDPPGRDRCDEDEMPTQAGFDGTLPRPRAKLVHSGSERAAEDRSYLFGRAIRILILKHEDVADAVGGGRIRGFPGKLSQCTRGLCACLRPPSVRREIDVTKRSASRLGKAFRVV